MVDITLQMDMTRRTRMHVPGAYSGHGWAYAEAVAQRNPDCKCNVAVRLAA